MVDAAARPKRPGSWAYPRRQLKVQRKRAAQTRGPLLPAAQAPEPRVISSSARVTCSGKPVAPGLASPRGWVFEGFSRPGAACQSPSRRALVSEDARTPGWAGRLIVLDLALPFGG